MKIAVFSTKPYDRAFFEGANASFGHELTFLEHRLTKETAALAADFPAICAFVNDEVDAEVLAELAAHGTRLVALRAAASTTWTSRPLASWGSRSHTCQPIRRTPWPSTPAAWC